MSAIILDTETTDADDKREIIELAYIGAFAAPADVLDHHAPSVFRFKPSEKRPISYGAMAVHHIIPEDLAGEPPWPGKWPLPAGVQYLVGHKVDFDWQGIGSPPEVKRICTLALSRYLYPLLDSHTLGAVMYMTSGSRNLARGILRFAHGAAHDVEIVAWVLPKLMGALSDKGNTVNTWEQLWQISEIARVPTVMSFGKHKGMAIKDVPRDYKRWMLNQPDCDPYLAMAFRI